MAKFALFFFGLAFGALFAFGLSQRYSVVAGSVSGQAAFVKCDRLTGRTWVFTHDADRDSLGGWVRVVDH